jgi:hypothetical protein
MEGLRDRVKREARSEKREARSVKRKVSDDDRKMSNVKRELVLHERAKSKIKNHPSQIENPPRTIGLLQERSLHAALKTWYAQPGDAIEVPLDGFHIDIVRGDLLIEIQTRNFFAMKRKLLKLLEHHRLRLVHPIAQEKWLVRVASDGETVLGRRRSPKHGVFEDIFDELVSIPGLLDHPNFSLEILLIHEEEIRRVRGAREKPARRTRFPRDWDRHDHRLVQVLASRVIESAQDLRAFLPSTLPREFTNRDLAAALGSYHRAQTMTYVMRQSGILHVIGKRGHSILYAMA